MNLDEVIKYKFDHIFKCKGVISLLEQRSLASNHSNHGGCKSCLDRDFVGFLSRGGLSVISEMKRKSPSSGELPKSSYPTYPDRLADRYCKGGVSAISVLTDIRYFDGNVNDLRKVRDVSCMYNVGVLAKDFVIDEYQIYQFKFYSADAILLIVGILEPSHYADLYELSVELGMCPLVEVHTEEELDIALRYANPRVIGVNNRDLRTLGVDLGVFPRISGYIPEGVVKVAESGMRSVDDVKMMVDSGADAVLVGESLLKGRFTVGDLLCLGV